MKKVFIIANWKSNKTESEAKEWFEGLRIEDLGLMNKEVVVCPSFTLFPILKSLIVNHNSNIKLCAQNISPFGEGSYTGEINGKQLKEFSEFVLIGHSERRQNFHEDDQMLEKKVEMAKKYGITPIFCIQNKDTYIPKDIEIVAYEPVSAIGTGNPDTPENADQVAKYVKENRGISIVIYGGSVTRANVKEFTQMPNLDGVLVGGASLDAKEFCKIIQNA